MQPWLATIGVFLLAFLGLALGLLTIKIKHKIWLLSYAFPLTLIILVALVRFFYRLRFLIPFSWISAGRNEFVVFAFAIPMMFGTLIIRLAKKREKTALSILLIVSSLYFFVMPFLLPILMRKKLENLQTEFSYDDICIQTTNYTCGPASAVTALMQFGIEAKESRLAIQAYTTPLSGTPDDLLADAIEKLYGSQGIRCTFRHFDSVEQLKQQCPVIAIVKFSFLVDHYVTVLEVKDDKLIIGDPLLGKQELTYEEFEDKWREVGIVVQKEM